MLLRAALAIMLSVCASGAPAQDFFTSREILSVTPKANPSLVAALIDNQRHLADHDIDTRLRVSHFLAQVMTETGGLRRLDENMNYSASRLTEVFSRKVITPEKAREIAGQPESVANWVYRNRLGNGGPESGDGWAFRGSGYIQLTGRTNYRLRGEEIGLPLEVEPDLVREPGPGLQAATAFWSARGINTPADLNDRRGIRRLVNGPRMEGLDQAILWHNRIWKGIYGGKAPFPNEGVMLETAENDLAADDDEALRRILVDEGYAEATAFESGTESAQADAAAEALRSFQESRGLSQTGVLDDDTFYAITDPEEWRTTETQEAAAAAPLGDADTGVSHALPGAEVSGRTLEPNPGSGASQPQPLELDEATELGAAKATYSSYETAEGRRERGSFIPQTVIGNDDRVAVLDTTAFPARAIVQILFRKREGLGQNLCTGAMIAPDLVLTAGHCVHGGTTMGRWYADFEVFPGRNTGAKPFGTCKAVKLYALQGWISAAFVSETRLYDLGAIRLDCTVGERTGWFGVKALPDGAFGQPTTVQGYAGDKAPAGRQWISVDQFRALETEKAFYENDTFGGTSGSPVFTQADHSITCVHTNGLHGSGNWARFNACTRMTPQRLSTITGWIED